MSDKMSDRIETAARAIADAGEDANWGDQALAVLAAADRWDAEHGYVRVKLDDPALIERIARAICEANGGVWPMADGLYHQAWLHEARAVLAALGSSGEAP